MTLGSRLENDVTRKWPFSRSLNIFVSFFFFYKKNLMLSERENLY